MAWEKSSEGLVETFYGALPEDDRVERRKMFGYPCAFVNGNMFTGLHQQDFIIRLPEDKRTTLMGKDGAKPFEPMPGRVMREYVAIPENILADPTSLRSWVAEAFQFAASMPAKQPKKRKPKKAKTG